MGSLFLNPFSFPPKKVMGLRDHEHKQRKKITKVYCIDGRKKEEFAKIKDSGSINLLRKKRDSIEIVRFLKDKKLLITGATGFLGKILVEKILRTVPDVGKIYLLIKANSKEAATERLKTEIVHAKLFDCLQKAYGKSYEAFMLSKLVPVVGNVCEHDLGLENDLAEVIMNDVNIIVNSAAATTFDERYDVSININTKGPYHLLGFAKKCDNLKLLLQVSTAYVTEQREGRIMEKRLCMADSTVKEEFVSETPERYIIHGLNVENEMKLCLNFKQGLKDNIVTPKMKELGMQRAKEFGWQNTYTFTKAMGEMIIDNMRGEIPVVILRPSIIESTYNDPFPGWIQGNRMMDPLLLNYGKGHLTGFLLNPHTVFDVIPADMVVNAILASMAKHGDGTTAMNEDINTYHLASSVANPLVSADLLKFVYQHFKSSPFIDSTGKPIEVADINAFTSEEDFFVHLWRNAAKRNEVAAEMASSKDKQLEIIKSSKWLQRAKQFDALYRPYTSRSYWFDIGNTQTLMECMSEEEKKKFNFDVRSIDWKDYFMNVHIPGLRRHVLKERS